jgi:hypothetical protein
LTGQKFARLTVTGRAPNNKFNQTAWFCVCDCGTRSVVNAHSLRGGKTRSCGCLNSEVVAAACRKRNTTHGESRSSENIAWLAMKERTCNPNFKQHHNYGGRGIRVCERWLNSFDNFLADMGRKPSPKHSLDRIDPNGNYSPENCRWATVAEQANNRTNNRFVEAFGERMTIIQWSRKTGVGRHNISNRLKAGWTPEQAVMTPAKHGQRIAS